MPNVSVHDQMLLAIGTSKAAALAATVPNLSKRYPLPLGDMTRQVTSDRLTLAGDHLRAGDQMIFALEFRSAISRHYYAMYSGARAIVFAETQGDDHNGHSDLPRHLPPALPDVTRREAELTDARLLRNEADYCPYPLSPTDWEQDARQLAVTAAQFVQVCEDFALQNGYV